MTLNARNYPHLAQLIESRWPRLLEPVHESWFEVLEPVAEHIAHAMERAEASGEYAPREDQVFAALALPRTQVKVLIVGQDPYPTPGDAMGLAFSTAASNRPPRSLANIYAELASDLGHTVRATGDLSSWQDQGVLLLNRVLTVSLGQAGSHRGQGWEEVTQALISSLNDLDQAVVAILWGKQAQQVGQILRCPTICSPHPSPLSARRGFFGSRPFSQANQALEELGSDGIDWRL